MLALWRYAGINILYFLAGMQSIPTEYYEAASIDGASRVQQFFHITIPNLKPTLVYVDGDQHLRRPGDVPRELHALRRQQLAEQPGADRRRLPLPQGDRGERPGLRLCGGCRAPRLIMAINLTYLVLTGTFKKEASR